MKESKKIFGLFFRYIFIVLVGLGNLFLFYKILTPATIKSVYLILSLFSNTVVVENFIAFRGIVIEIAPACVAGSAFYLLFVLVFSTPKISPKKRVFALLTAILSLFVLNILRIIILIPLVNTSFFETLHWIVWHLVSTIFVVGIWLSVIHFFEIKSVPIYSDVKFLISLIKFKKKN